ncbi:MAG TPA: hypothetical protein VKM93_17300 [Terriglobia bacterium]|nr:hypothetical protein [Terriglobia bacterium]
MSKLETGNWKIENRKSKIETGNSPINPDTVFRGEFRFSNFDFRVSKWIAALAASVVGLLAASPILAQGCALCYNTAAAASSKGITALRHGVLILMLPPVVIFGVVTFFTVRGRNRFNDEAESFEEQGRAA